MNQPTREEIIQEERERIFYDFTMWSLCGTMMESGEKLYRMEDIVKAINNEHPQVKDSRFRMMPLHKLYEHKFQEFQQHLEQSRKAELEEAYLKGVKDYIKWDVETGENGIDPYYFKDTRNGLLAGFLEHKKDIKF